MHIQRIHFDRVFDVQRSHGFFSYESAGEMTYSVNLPGRVIPQEGATWDVAFETLGDWNTMLGWRDLATHQVRLNRDLVKLLSNLFDVFYLLSIPVLALFLVYGGMTIAMAVMLAAAIAGIWMILRIVNRRRCVRAALLTA
jgi:hypothetical protein